MAETRSKCVTNEPCDPRDSIFPVGCVPDFPACRIETSPNVWQSEQPNSERTTTRHLCCGVLLVGTAFPVAQSSTTCDHASRHRTLTNQVPWTTPANVEQDLVLSRLIIELANHPLLGQHFTTDLELLVAEWPTGYRIETGEGCESSLRRRSNG